MKLITLILYDLNQGIVRNWKKYVAAFLLFLLFAYSLVLTNARYNFVISHLTLGDFIMNFTFGMKEYIYSPGNPFIFPALWILLFALIAFITLYYPYNELIGVGKHLLILSGSRVHWWFSKCMWIFVSVFAYFAFGLLATFLFAFVSGGSLSLQVSQELPLLLEPELTELLLAAPWHIVQHLLSIIVMTTSICLMQMLISLLIKPIFSYLATLSLLLISAYFYRGYFIGNYMMTARSSILINGGFQMNQGILATILLGLFAMIVGSIIFSRMNVINKE